MRNRTGFSLLELAIALALLLALALIAFPSLARARERTAVNAARAELAAGVAVARSTAILAGGATLVIDLSAATAWIETAAGAAPARYDVGARYGVTLHADRGARVVLRFDALGIGRMSNAHVRLRRGRAEASLVVSAYGRVRS
jgi:prepilin-type N-terminal cleavage/methylation domain-containing protein